jgi:hypothetical protein
MIQALAWSSSGGALVVATDVGFGLARMFGALREDVSTEVRVFQDYEEAVARPAFRDLLLEAAKERLRERFGEEITALAEGSWHG